MGFNSVVRRSFCPPLNVLERDCVFVTVIKSFFYHRFQVDDNLIDIEVMAELPADAIAEAAAPEPTPEPESTPTPAKQEASPSPPPPPPPSETSTSTRTEIKVCHCIPCAHEPRGHAATHFRFPNVDSPLVFVTGTNDEAAQDDRTATEREPRNCGIADHIQRGARTVGRVRL